jgi:hypothetical protein
MRRDANTTGPRGQNEDTTSEPQDARLHPSASCEAQQWSFPGSPRWVHCLTEPKPEIIRSHFSMFHNCLITPQTDQCLRMSRWSDQHVSLVVCRSCVRTHPQMPFNPIERSTAFPQLLHARVGIFSLPFGATEAGLLIQMLKPQIKQNGPKIVSTSKMYILPKIFVPKRFLIQLVSLILSTCSVYPCQHFNILTSDQWHILNCSLAVP